MSTARAKRIDRGMRRYSQFISMRDEYARLSKDVAWLILEKFKKPAHSRSQGVRFEVDVFEKDFITVTIELHYHGMRTPTPGKSLHGYVRRTTRIIQYEIKFPPYYLSERDVIPKESETEIHMEVLA